MRTFFLSLICISFFACENKSQTAVKTDVKVDTTAQSRVISSTVIVKDSSVADGEEIIRYKNGVVKMRGMKKNGKREGEWRSFYENGSPWSITNFKEGKKEGPTTTWYENEQMRYQGFYTNDVESGKWKFWNERGVVVQEADYDKKPGDKIVPSKQ